ncbi:hypothetical protein SLS56_000857 [Neofusicoccum ribis]|uniref:Aminotransferase class I/classII large domain-containing protein n=1 Tax=Neofusicoccum ribis TaxID=45134 RepID=A0ABR3TC87_9PEZI
MSHFAGLPVTPPDAAFSLVAAFAADDFPEKVDLCPGFYRDEEANPWILPSVAKAKQLIHDDPTTDHEHLPLSGHPELIANARDLVFGSGKEKHARIASIQTVSGTGSNHLGARFLSDELAPPKKRVWISDPSWINHTEIWLNVNPGIERRIYPYYARDTQSLDFEGMKRTLLRDAAAGDVVILHGCAHNPTGLDLTREQWEIIAYICEEKDLFPFFDLAYPPAFGARIVAKIFGDQVLYQQWQDDLHQMSRRMKQMRQRLYEELKKRETPGSWEHILVEIGMFSITGLSPAQVKVLKEEYHVYLLPSGRISVTGLTEANVAYVAEAFDKVLRSTESKE